LPRPGPPACDPRARPRPAAGALALSAGRGALRPGAPRQSSEASTRGGLTQEVSRFLLDKDVDLQLGVGRGLVLLQVDPLEDLVVDAEVAAELATLAGKDGVGRVGHDRRGAGALHRLLAADDEF